jgi:hypothetical protein
MNILTKIKLQKTIFHFLNTFNLIFALALIGSGIYLWTKAESFNTFILAIMSIGLIIAFTTMFSYCCTNKSPCALLMAIILLILIFVFIVTLGVCIIFFQEKIIDFLVQSMKDSEAVIEELKEQLNKNMDLTKIIALSYSVIIVNFYLKYSFLILLLDAF